MRGRRLALSPLVISVLLAGTIGAGKGAGADPAPLWVDRVATATPDFIITTQLGNDTLIAHEEGSIIFYVNAAGWNLSAITMPIDFTFGGAGNLIGPITQNPADPAFISFSAYAQEKMEDLPFNGILGNAFTGDPDTLLLSALDYNGDGWDTDGELARITFTPSNPGTIQIRNSFVPPTSGVAMLDQNASEIPFNFYEPYTIIVVGETLNVEVDTAEILINTEWDNDTMYVNGPGSIIFYVNAVGWNLAAITMPLEFKFNGGGNLIGPITENPSDPAVFSYSAYAQAKMENKPFNSILGNDFTDDPDTLLFGALDFNGDGWDIDGELCRITFVPRDTGSITIHASYTPPAGQVGLLDQNSQDIQFNWYGPYTITVVECPVMMGDVNEDGTINSADLIYMVNYIFKSGPDPLPMRTVGDANCTGGLGGSDIISLVNYIFKGGQPPCACYVRII